MLFPASPARSRPAGAALSRGRTADKRSKGLIAILAIRPLICTYFVAGRDLNPQPLGYEPYDVRLCGSGGSHCRPTSACVGLASPSVLPVFPDWARPAASRLRIRLQEQSLACGFLHLPSS